MQIGLEAARGAKDSQIGKRSEELAEGRRLALCPQSVTIGNEKRVELHVELRIGVLAGLRFLLELFGFEFVHREKGCVQRVVDGVQRILRRIGSRLALAPAAGEAHQNYYGGKVAHE
jgi:hypothetical protein